ncbi:MAG: hypothetical protein JXA24_04515 [Proteobacteria bacterium]|nr:hypothetical protein [Pseudomonadota bacterium]
MKKMQRHSEFAKEICRLVARLKKLRPGETHVLSIDANYGHYELILHTDSHRAHKGRQMGMPLEISGEIHHLFVTHGALRPNPSQQQVRANLRDTVIARGLTVHLQDPVGDGEHLKHEDGGNGLDAKEFINLAGESGEKLIWEARHDENLSLEAYHIIQQDILKALRRHKRQALEYVS